VLVHTGWIPRPLPADTEIRRGAAG
jgi:hypothetical protein